MRTIKFRGKVKTTNEWVCGSLLVWGDGEHNIYVPREHNYKVDAYNVEPSTIGQFTGAYDRNGKEIYEGDIVFAKSAGEFKKCLVVYADHSCNFILHTKIGPWYIHGEIDSMLEVIGNIHDNPELIK